MKKYILGLGLMFSLGFGSVACGGTEGDEAQSEAEQADQAARAGAGGGGAGGGVGVVSYPCSYSACVTGCVATPGLSTDYCRLVCRIDSRCF